MEPNPFFPALQALRRSGEFHNNLCRRQGGGMEITMEKYVCELCGYVYDPSIGDPDNGVEPGAEFDELPADWGCPLCGATKEDFEKVADEDGADDENGDGLSDVEL